MDPQILPAYSLRVQLFLSTANSLGDKPVRNFRVVTSPKITVRNFCVEASRIHEINYGEPLSIKKVQDDQGFDITQSEILGNLFSASSIVRIVQAQKYLHMRDSIPPTSGLRFNPSLVRRREKREDICANGSTVFWGPNKRRRISYHDPDNPLPSREVSLPISHDNAASEDLGMIDSQKVCQASIQISETPEPANASQEIDPKYLHGHMPFESATASHYDNDMLERQSSLPTIVPNKNFTPLFGKTNYQIEQATSECIASNKATSSPGLEEQLSQNGYMLGTSNNHMKNSQLCIKKGLEGVTCNDNNSKYNKPQGINTDQKAIPSIVPKNELSKIKHGNKFLENRAQTSSSDNQLKSDEMRPKINGQVIERSSKTKSAHDTKNRRSLNGDLKTQQKFENETKHAVEQRREPEIRKADEGDKFEKKERDVSPNKSNQQVSPNLGIEFGKVEEQNSVIETADNKPHDVDVSRRQRKKSLTKREYEKRASQKKTSSANAENLINIEMNKKKLHTAKSSGRKLEKESRQSPPSTPNLSQVMNSSPNLSQSKSETICSDGQLVNLVLRDSPKKSSFPAKISPSKSIPQNEILSSSVPSSKGGRMPLQRAENDTSIKPPHRILPDTSAPVQTRAIHNTNDEAPSASKANLITQKTSVTPILPPKKITNTVTQVSKKIGGNNAATNSSSRATSSSKPGISSKVTPIIPPKFRHSMVNSLQKEKNSSNFQIRENDNKRSDKSLAETSTKRINGSPSTKTKDDDSKYSTTPSKIITDQKNLRHPRKHSQISQPDGSIDQMEGLGNEENHSQDSDERDSRSPVAFHYISELPKTQQSPSLSSESQIEIEDDEDTEMKNISVTPKISESHQHGTRSESRGSRDLGEKELQVKLNVQAGKSNNDSTPILSSKIEIPNSSLPLNQNPTKGSGRKGIKSSQFSNNVTNASNPDAFEVPSSSEERRPLFGFGASLNAMHRNGGIMGKSQSISTKNEKSSAVIQNDTESFSESEASNSELDSNLSSEPGHPTQSKLAENSAAVLQGSESDSDDSDAEEERAKAKAKAELLAKVRSLNSSQKSDSVQNIRRSGRVNVGVPNYQSNQRKK